MAVGKTRQAGKEQVLEDLIQVRLNRLTEIVEQLAKTSVRAKGMQRTDLRILSTLFDEPAVSINELSRRAHVDKAWISRSVIKLMEKKWITKKDDPNDSRAQLVSLTARGRKLFEQVLPRVQENERLMLEGINEASLKKQLDRLMLNAEALMKVREAELKNKKNR